MHLQDKKIRAWLLILLIVGQRCSHAAANAPPLVSSGEHVSPSISQNQVSTGLLPTAPEDLSVKDVHVASLWAPPDPSDITLQLCRLRQAPDDEDYAGESRDSQEKSSVESKHEQTKQKDSGQEERENHHENVSSEEESDHVAPHRYVKNIFPRERGKDASNEHVNDSKAGENEKLGSNDLENDTKEENETQRQKELSPEAEFMEEMQSQHAKHVLTDMEEEINVTLMAIYNASRNVAMMREAISNGDWDTYAKLAQDLAKESEITVAKSQTISTLASAESKRPVSVKVLSACGAVVAFSWFWIALGWFQGTLHMDDLFARGDGARLLPIDEDEGEPEGPPALEDSRPKQCGMILLFAAFLYWCALPATSLVMGLFSTCAGGTPNLAYAIYAGFLLVHLSIASIAGYYLGTPKCLSGKLMESLPVLTLFTILEHFDMSTDSLFVGSTEACSSLIMADWLQSWEHVPLVGSSLAGTFGQMHFSGLALTIYVTCTYVPQLLGLWSFFAAAFAGSTFSIVYLWVYTDWYFGLPVMLAFFGAFSGLPIIMDMDNQWQNLQRTALQSPQEFALFSGMLIFEPMVVASADNDAIKGEWRPLMFGLTRLAFENLIQLWLQSSYFAAAFDLMDDMARLKMALSISLGFAVALSKLVPITICFFKADIGNEMLFNPQEDLFGFILALGALLFLIACALFSFWVVAKVFFAFKCESHIWNLFSGCV